MTPEQNDAYWEAYRRQQREAEQRPCASPSPVGAVITGGARGHNILG
jgi:hypothetical protein